MTLLALPFPNIDPVALAIGPITIKWYGLAYMAGLLFGWLYIRNLVSQQRLWPAATAPFPAARADDLLLYMTVGVIIGGRFGFIFFYEPGYYLANPLEVFAIWKGGMAFHGALLGCGLAVWAFSARAGCNTFSAMDACAASVPIGLFFGRIANFINGELYGRPTDMPWGMIFPEAVAVEGDSSPRHPSQLYEAALEGLLLFIVLRILTHRQGSLQSPGLTTGVFLLGYGLARSFCELLRQYDPQHAFSVFGLTPGIVYSIPMILLGIWFIRSSQARFAA